MPGRSAHLQFRISTNLIALHAGGDGQISSCAKTRTTSEETDNSHRHLFSYAYARLKRSINFGAQLPNSKLNLVGLQWKGK